MLSSSFDPKFIFGRGSFSSNESAKLEGNLQKVFPLSFELKEPTPFSFNDILDYFSPLEGIPRDFTIR